MDDLLPGTPLRRTITTTGDETVVGVSPEIDVTNANYLRATLRDELALHPRALIVDLTTVTFCSARGLGVLAETARTAEETGVVCFFATQQRALLRPLHLLGLDRVLRVVKTVPDALNLIAAAQATPFPRQPR
ncbi:STAS domain-containing protein [Amycolatopsis jejuensis]|uniref:STAS domain-containing protein n=1 Tax=Amycolatopsis jejuensis TaxID=330084 RepID=UPI00068C6132|nr:STAS domain-containing protein [Amycolatopsis jejuensis]